MKTVMPQHMTYPGKDMKAKYLQHRINIPDDVIKKLGWNNENQIILNVNKNNIFGT
ncbi:MAG: hypothetical protein OEM77_08005 [Nitrosopumilus sp.]|nr:hypothetical protein [Nitrosopumilus sp.]MDH3823118.1 hypothetical protein [Nitrosopumilus sp.]MDH3833432.1 hypothetical protein [Nitrosopumilus sp.]